MIEITLYQNNSGANFVNKDLTEVGTFQGNMRDSASVTDPVITIATDSVISFVNYAYIPMLGRKYFVMNITILRSGLYQLTLHVDVLCTYWDNIKLLNAVIGRQENLYNLYLDDDKFVVTPQRIYTTLAFPNRVASGSGENTASFILTLAGGELDDQSN